MGLFGKKLAQDTVITDDMLDQLHALQQRRLREIEETGEAVTLVRTSTPLKTIRTSPDLWLFSAPCPLKLGDTLRHVDVRGHYIVTSLIEQAGRVAATVHLLTSEASFYVAAPVATDLLGRTHYRLQPQNWTRIPCSPVTAGKVTFPAAYRPDAGDVLLIGSDHWQVSSSTLDRALCTAAVEPF